MGFLFRTILSSQLGILIVILILGCESKPVQIDLGDSGHELKVFSTDSIQFQSIQLPNRIGTSSKLYLGSINGKKSSIIFKLNADVFSQHESLCTNDLDSLSFSFKIKLINENEVAEIPLENLQDSVLNTVTFIENTNDDIAGDSIRAYLSFQSDMENKWDEFSFIDLDTNLNSIVVDGNMIPIESLKAIELPVSLLLTGIDISLDSIDVANPGYNGLINKLCNNNDDESIWIFLENDNDALYLYGSSNNSNPSSLPYLSASYNEKFEESFTIEKFEIVSITTNISNNFYLSIQDDINVDEFGTIIGLPIDITNAEPIDTSNPDLYTMFIDFQDSTQIDFATVKLNPTFHENDTSHSIEISINSPIFVYRNFDPSGDNYQGAEDTVGTENNGYYDDGEYFMDCGLDLTCNELEYGFNNSGTENNNQYDIGEIFFDCGVDGLCNNNTFLNHEECDSIGYEWVDNEGCIIEIESFEDILIDDYNPDPMGDDYDIETNPEGTENNNQCDIGEPFLDYGIDGIPDSLEGQNFEYDNFNVLDSTGTEGNGKWDFGEWYIDAGLDTVWSSNEEGYNIEGTENNNIYDYGEIYFDFGIDRIQNIDEPDYNELINPDPLMDDLNLDPVGDDWKDCGLDTLCVGDEGYIESDEGESNGIFDIGERWEGNGIINFLDLNGDSLLGVNDISEKWYDWGIDQTPDSAENYYGSYPLLVELGENSYTWNDTLFQDVTFVQPELEGSEDIALWISKIHKIENENQIELTLSLFSLSEFSAFQFQIGHNQYYYQDTIITYSTEDLYFINSLRLIEDISVYPQSLELLEEDFLSFVNYGESIVTLLDFQDLEIFLAENSDIIISDAIVTIYSDTTLTSLSENFRLYLKRLLEPYATGDDSISTDFILDYPYYRIYNSPPDSIQFSIKKYLQRLINDEYSYNKFIISTDGTGNNFENYYFKNDSTYTPKLDILYSR